MKSDKNKQRILRLASENDQRALMKLWQDCFHDTKEFTEYYFSTYFKENKVWTLIDKERLVAMLHLNPYQIAMGVDIINSWYIVGVATDENYRYQGAMTSLLKKVFEEGYRTGMPFVYLMPAKEAIYRPFQFAYIYEQLVEKLVPSVENTPIFSAKITNLSPESDIHYERIADLSNKILQKNYQLFTWRTAHYFRRLQLENQVDGGDLIMLMDNGTLIGYCSYAKEDHVEVREIACLPEYHSAISEWLNIFFYADHGELLPAGEDTYGGEHFKRPIIMGRIINLLAWMKMMPKSTEDFTLDIEIIDHWISDNSGVYRWTQTKGEICFEKGDFTPQICISIDDLMQWLTGYRTVIELIAEKKLILNEQVILLLEQIPVWKGLKINEII